MAESETLSVDASTENQEDPLQELSDEKLYRLLEETHVGNDVLQAETQMFEKYLKRCEPKDLAVTYQVVNTETSSTPSQSTHDLSSSTGPTTRHSRKRSKSRSSTIDVLRLTAEQKCEIAQREIEEYRDEIDRLKDESEKKLDTYKAILEEADMRMLEVKKDAFEFERDIVKGSINPRTGKVVAEKVTRHFEENFRSKDTLIEKLRLKNSTLKVQKNKLTLQLKQKEEMGEVLHEVDFNQLKIENQQYMEKIDERNQDLLRLKLMAGNTLQVLNAYKKKLQTLTAESDRLKNEISQRQELVSRIDAETKLAEDERQKAEVINKKLRQQLGDFMVPDVMEYVGEKADLYELQKKVRSWERKVEIAEMALKTHRKTWQQLRLTGPNPIPWQGMQAM